MKLLHFTPLEGDTPFLEVGPERKIMPHEPDTWKLFFFMGLTTGALLFGVKRVCVAGLCPKRTEK